MFLGCGPKGSSLPTQHVQGVIKLDGSPLEGALLTFTPVAADGVAASGYSDAEGVYQLTSVGGDPQRGALVGDYTVTVNKVSITMVKTPPLNPGEEPQETAVQKSLLHKNYNNAKTTPLKATVVQGKNVFDFSLTKDGD